MIISISGPQHSGKTTLLNYLKKKNPNWKIITSEEGVIRNLKRRFDISINKDVCYRSQYLINSQHIINVIANENNNTILDRCALDSLIYTYYNWLNLVNAKSKLSSTTPKSLNLETSIIKEKIKDAKIIFDMTFTLWDKLSSYYDNIFVLDPKDTGTIKQDGIRNIDKNYQKTLYESYYHWNQPNIKFINGTVKQRLEKIKQYAPELNID